MSIPSLPGRPIRPSTKRIMKYMQREDTNITKFIAQLSPEKKKKKKKKTTEPIHRPIEIEKRLAENINTQNQVELNLLEQKEKLAEAITEHNRTIVELEREQAKKSQSIVEMMIDNSWERFRWAFITLLIAGAIQVFLFRAGIDFPIWSAILLIAFAAIFYVNQAVFEYRVRKGYYGASDYEAREIVKYIFTNGKEIGRGGGGGNMRIAPEPERETETGIIPEGKAIS